jgi:hypothetical protein
VYEALSYEHSARINVASKASKASKAYKASHVTNYTKYFAQKHVFFCAFVSRHSLSPAVWHMKNLLHMLCICQNIIFPFFFFLKKKRQTAVGTQRTILQYYDAGKMAFTALLYYFTTLLRHAAE